MIKLRSFAKNDSGFICENCGEVVKSLKYTSRNHCPYCLHSKHVDINPGDRENVCRGLMSPVAVTETPQKGYVITFKCQKCGAVKNNKSAADDDFEKLLTIAKNSV